MCSMSNLKILKTLTVGKVKRLWSPFLSPMQASDILLQGQRMEICIDDSELEDSINHYAIDTF